MSVVLLWDRAYSISGSREVFISNTINPADTPVVTNMIFVVRDVFLTYVNTSALTRSQNDEQGESLPYSSKIVDNKDSISEMRDS